MIEKKINLSVTPKEASDRVLYTHIAAEKLGIDEKDITSVVLRRRSIDARQRNILVNLGLSVYLDGVPEPTEWTIEYKNVEHKPSVGIVGSGPAGLFAALKIIEEGFRPVLFERGRDVSERKKDIAQMYRNSEVNGESNYAFGEGGAGTFSDGKLYTRSKKRGKIQNILDVFIHFGADPEIGLDARPHIGTDKLPGIIASMRKKIIECGGEIHFNSKVTELILKDKECKGIVLSDGTHYEFPGVILSTGHSARDIYEMLYREGIALEEKSFAMGVRVEHPQKLIDQISYHAPERGEYLPPATYKFAKQVQKRGVYSFCMCPGGFIVPAGTSSNEIVVNGMSASQRNSPFANSGMVVEIHPEDLKEYRSDKIFAGLNFQRELEQKCFQWSDHSLKAPAQRLTDFIKGRESSSLPDTSYIPGLVSVNLRKNMPSIIASRLQEGLMMINQRSRGFVSSEAIAVGVESRTSSPLRIPRDPETMTHIHIKGLYPCGEGAGYAGGIVSSAIDGERCAITMVENIKAKFNL